MGTAIGAPKRKRTKRTSEQIQSLPYGGGMWPQTVSEMIMEQYERRTLQDDLQRIGEKNDILPSKTLTDQNESVSIAGNRHCTTREQ